MDEKYMDGKYIDGKWVYLGCTLQGSEPKCNRKIFDPESGKMYCAPMMEGCPYADPDFEATKKASKESEFQKELEKLINRHSMENGCDCPDFILADYLMSCLRAFNFSTKAREKWYGTHLSINEKCEEAPAENVEAAGN